MNRINIPNRYQGEATCGFFNIKGFAHEMRLHEMTVYRMVRKGSVRGFKLGGQWRIPKSEIDRVAVDGA